MPTPSITNPEFLYLREAHQAITRALSTLNGLRRKTVLDLGCGKKNWKSYFEKMGALYIGSDLHPSLRPDVVMAAERLAILPESFDLVISLAVFEHLVNPQQSAKEITRVLKPGGRLVLQTHGFYPYHPDPFDHWRWTHTGLEKMLNDAHLTVEKIYPSGNTLTTYLTFTVHGVNLLMTRISILSWGRKFVIPILNLLGLFTVKLLQPKTTFDKPGSLIISYTVLAGKPTKTNASK